MAAPEAIDQLQRNNVHSFQRPDADHVEIDPLADTLRGHSGMVSFGKIAGERTRMNVNVGYKSPGFDVNDLGFQQRADVITQNSWFQIRRQTPGKYTRNMFLNFNQWTAFNFDGDQLESGGNFNMNMAVPESVASRGWREHQRPNLRRPPDARWPGRFQRARLEAAGNGSTRTIAGS